MNAECPGRPSRRSVAGFTLIELMIVVVVVALLAAVALPSYFSSIRKSRRADAVQLMAQVAQAQERLRANSSSFSNDFGTSFLNVRTAAVSGVTSLAETYYTISVPTSTATAYTVRAVAAGSQASDTRCAVMEMRMSLGNLTYLANTAVGTLNPADPDPNRCWSR